VKCQDHRVKFSVLANEVPKGYRNATIRPSQSLGESETYWLSRS